MKIILSTLLLSSCIMAIGITSCKDTVSNSSDNTTALNVINGKIASWPYGDSAAVTAVTRDGGDGMLMRTLGTAIVNKDGSFLFVLTTPPSSVLNYVFDSVTKDTVWKVNVDYLLVGYPHGGTVRQASLPFEQFYSDSAKVGEYIASYWYVDRDAQFKWDLSDGQYDLHLKKGWNRVVKELVSKTPSKVYKLSVLNVDEGLWYYDGVIAANIRPVQ